MSLLKISVAICTWNRANLLRQTLEHMQRLETDGRFDWELVIVNNNSTDHTQQVIEEFRQTLPIVDVFEPMQGHSQSRNRAVATASGDYLVWTDNDVLVEANWLVAYYEAFEKNPDTIFFGGVIEPEFETPRPAWLEATWDICKAVYATRMLGDQPRELDEKTLPYGANFAIRMDIQRQYLYNTTFGRKAGGMVGEDEVAVLRAIVKDGYRGMWVPAARLKHFIPTDRICESYVRNYYIGQGQTNVMVGKTNRNRWLLLCEAVYNYARYAIKRHYARPLEWVSHLIRASLSWGEFKASRHAANRPGKSTSET